MQNGIDKDKNLMRVPENFEKTPPNRDSSCCDHNVKYERQNDTRVTGPK